MHTCGMEIETYGGSSNDKKSKQPIINISIIHRWFTWQSSPSLHQHKILIQILLSEYYYLQEGSSFKRPKRDWSIMYRPFLKKLHLSSPIIISVTCTTACKTCSNWVASSWVLALQCQKRKIRKNSINWAIWFCDSRNYILADIEDGIEVINIDCPHTVRVWR